MGALEPQFFAVLVDRLGVQDRIGVQHDESRHAEMVAVFEEAFRAHPLAHWTDLFEGTNACVAPVLTPTEAYGHQHLRARGTYLELDGVPQAAPAPRFAGTPTAPPTSGLTIDIADALARWPSVTC